MSEFRRLTVEVMRRIRPEQTVVICAMCATPGWVIAVSQSLTADIEHLDQRRCRALWVYRRELEERPP